MIYTKNRLVPPSTAQKESSESEWYYAASFGKGRKDDKTARRNLVVNQ